jgi:hypothetical protein
MVYEYSNLGQSMISYILTYSTIYSGRQWYLDGRIGMGMKEKTSGITELVKERNEQIIRFKI